MIDTTNDTKIACDILTTVAELSRDNKLLALGYITGLAASADRSGEAETQTQTV